MLCDPVDCDKFSRATNGGEVRVTKIGTSTFCTIADGRGVAIIVRSLLCGHLDGYHFK